MCVNYSQFMQQFDHIRQRLTSACGCNNYDNNGNTREAVSGGSHVQERAKLSHYFSEEVAFRLRFAEQVESLS